MKRKKKPKESKLETVPSASIRLNAVVHSDFPDDLLNRIRILWERVKDYAPMKTLEQWEIGFMRDSQPVVEIALWEKMADAVETATKELAMDPEVVFATVLTYAGGMVQAADWAQSPRKEIVAICKRVGLAPTPIQLQRR